ncbi:MAG: nucleotidyltransferase family protein [Hyphomicrobiaceae bacterium]
MHRIRSAMILAAGLGTRMRPLTDRIPKPLVQLAGRPLIDHVLDRLDAAGIGRCIVNVHHLAAAIEAHLAHHSRPAIIISDERDALLDTGGGVMRALPLIGDDTFLVHNSDSVWIEGTRPAIPMLLGSFDPQRMDCLMLLAHREQCLGYDGVGDFDMDAEGRLTRRAPDGETPYVFAGVSIMHRRLMEGAPAGAFSLNRQWDRAMSAGRLCGLVMDGFWMHVGTPAALGEAEARVAAVGAGAG